MTVKFQAFSFLARCLCSQDQTAISRRAAVPAVIQTPISHDYRKMVAVEVRGEPFWADRATGTLYWPDTGECLSSTSMQLVVASIGRAFDEMRKHYPDLQKHWVSPDQKKPGPKAGTKQQKAGGWPFNQTGEL